MKNEIKINRMILALFLKTGIIVLSFLAIIILSVKYVPTVVSVTSHSNGKKLPIYRVETDNNNVALTFDVMNNNKDIDKILEILEKHNVKATFFLTGTWVEKYPQEVKKLVEAGHDIGNRGYHYKHMELLDYNECKEEMVSLHDKVKELTSLDMELFRSPYGGYNNTVIHAARDLGYHSIKWDIDSLDWKDYGVNEIVRKTTRDNNLKSGSIILLHTGTKYTVDALEEIILGLKEQNYEMTCLSDLIYQNDYIVDLSGSQIKK